jgi:ADP-heptose:LPS heptosyltransferase
VIAKFKGILLRWITNVKIYPFDPAQIKKIIILRYDRIGDMIVSLPLFKALRSGFSDAEIIIIASQANACIAQDSRFIDRTVVKPNGLFKWLNCLLLIRSERPDLAIDLNHAVAPHTIFAIRIMQPKHVASPFKDGRWGVPGSDLRLFDLMPNQHPKKYRRPIAETYLDIARLIGFSTGDCLPYPLPHYEKSAQSLHQYIVLNPCGSRETMRIRDDYLSEIALFLNHNSPGSKIIVPAMADNWESLCSLFCSTSNVTVLEPSQTVKPLLPLIQYANLVITPDTALVHIACAYNTPVIAVYTNEQALLEQWRPLCNIRTRVILSESEKSIENFSIDDLLRAIPQLTEKST